MVRKPKFYAIRVGKKWLEIRECLTPPTPVKEKHPCKKVERYTDVETDSLGRHRYVTKEREVDSFIESIHYEGGKRLAVISTQAYLNWRTKNGIEGYPLPGLDRCSRIKELPLSELKKDVPDCIPRPVTPAPW